MEKKTILIAIIVVAIFATTACCVSTKYTIVASGHPAWSPVMYQSGEHISGIGPEVASKVAEDIGFDFKSIYVGSWDMVQQRGKAGEIDLIVAMYKTTEREKYFYFSIPYTVDPITPFIAKDKTFSLNKKEDLLGKKGVVTKGDSYGQELDDYIVKANLDITVVETPDQGFSMIKEGKADYFLYSAYAGKAIIAEKNISGIKESGTISEQPFYMAISKKSPIAKYMNQINASIERQISDPNSSLNKPH